MKNIFSFFGFIILVSNQLIATPQEQDILHYENKVLFVDIGWGHPSPLETFYRQNNILNPFRMLSTANYRGHIATWEIVNNKFFLIEISINKDTFQPEKFGVKSKDNSYSSKNKVFADWFNGILNCYNRDGKYTVYFHIKNGEIVNSQKITSKDYRKIKNFTKKDTSNIELNNKYLMVRLNQSYISYYFRLNQDEVITFKNKKGYLKSSSIILEYFDDDHLKWPFNWENLELSGAPNGVWEIEEDTLFLKSVNLYTGLRLEGPEKVKVDLSEVFLDKKPVNKRIFADWANGVYIITYGINEKNEYGGFQFKETEYSFLNIQKGIVNESITIPRDFNYENLSVETSQEMQLFIKYYLKIRN